MDFYKLNEIQFILFGLALIRLIALFVSWPVFGESNVPVALKVLASLSITFLIFPVISVPKESIEAINQALPFMVIREVLIGLLIGYIARFFFFAFAMAGELISITMGLASAQMFNPSLGAQTSATSQFYLILATLFFLATNGHHILLSGLVQSFEFLPISNNWFETKEFFNFAANAQEIILIGVKLSAPILISILVVNVVLGICGKTVPQLNVLVTSFAVNIFVGLAILIVSLPFFMDQMQIVLNSTSETLFKFMRAI
jgi:flagellar biosynthesis protein FliR